MLEQALRRLIKQPAISLVLVLTFALGSGINIAIFSVVEVLLLRPLPYVHSDRLVAVWPSRVFSSEQFNYLRHSFREVVLPAAVSSGWEFSLTNIDQPEQVSGSKVTGNFFSLLGVRPFLGRPFTAEDRPGAPPVAVLSHQLWQRLGSNPEIVNRTIILDGTSFTVVGVMPSTFRYLQNTTDVWVPLVIDTGDPSFQSEHALIVGRLKSGSTIARANEDVRALVFRMQQDLHSPEELDREAPAVLLRDHVTKDLQPKLLLLLAGVGLVLLVACANIASLLLALALSRQREISVRAALGASRSRLMRLLLLESLLVATIGSLIGLAFAYWGVRALVAHLPPNTPRLEEMGISGVVLGYTILIALVGGLLCGLAPAIPGTRMNLSRTLGEGSQRSSEGRASKRLRSLLVVTEIALAVVLVVCAGLVSRSFWRLSNVNPGFRTDNALTFNLTPSPTRYKEPAQRRELYHQLLEQLRSTPNVLSVDAIQHLPLGGYFWNTTVEIEGHPTTPGEQPPSANWRLVTPTYISTMGIPLLKGRTFTAADREEAPDVVLINETMMKSLWPQGDAVGKRINAGRATSKKWATIVGVVGDIRHDGLNGEIKPEIYRPYDQQPLWNMTIVARTASDPWQLASSVRQIVSNIDKEIPVSKVQSLEDLVDHSIAQQRLIMRLFQLFAAIALALGMIGVYGVVSYNVNRRVQEIGVRIVLGANRFKLLNLFLCDGAAVVATGLVIGLLVSIWVTRLLQSLLFGISAMDGWTFALVALLVMATGLLASYLPAARATRISPREAILE